MSQIERLIGSPTTRWRKIMPNEIARVTLPPAPASQLWCLR